MLSLPALDLAFVLSYPTQPYPLHYPLSCPLSCTLCCLQYLLPVRKCALRSHNTKHASEAKRAFCLMRAKRACCNASEARIFAPVGGIASDTEYKTVGKTEGKAEGKAGQGRTKQRQGRGRVETTCERNRSMNNSLRSHNTKRSLRSHNTKRLFLLR